MKPSTKPKINEEKTVYTSSLPYPQALALKSISKRTKSKQKQIEDPSVLDHLCDNFDIKPTFDNDGALKMALTSKILIDDDDPDVDLMNLEGMWMPDLTLRFPPTFSDTARFFFKKEKKYQKKTNIGVRNLNQILNKVE